MESVAESGHFSQSTAGFIVPMITGLLSAFSSAIILNIIRLSPDKLSTTYHRLMASMSMFDFIASICIALVTLPMPSDNVLDFSGPMLGNRWTCQIQGYFITFGMGGGVTLYMCLSWYFVLSISFKMKKSTIKKKVEPIMFAYALFIAIFTPSYFLSKDMIHYDSRAAYCTIDIDDQRKSSCVDSSCEGNGSQKQDDGVAIWLGINTILIVLPMMIILRTIHKNNKSLNIVKSNTSYENEEASPEHQTRIDTNLVTELRNSRVAMVQALMYIFVYFITWIFLLLRHIDYQYYTDVGAAILFPLQGFWNMIIFVYDKAHTVYQTDSCDSWRKAVKIVLISPRAIPSLILELQVVEDSNLTPVMGEEVVNSIPSSAGGIQSYNSSSDKEGGSSDDNLFHTSECHSSCKSEVRLRQEPQEVSTLDRYPFFHSKRNSM